MIKYYYRIDCLNSELIYLRNLLQDSYQISYVQLDPLRHFPKLEINDIPEQRYIEIYLGNLMPGQNYNISITPQVKNVEGRPWNGILTTSSFL